MHENEIGTLLVDSAVPLHRDLGTGTVGDRLRSQLGNEATKASQANCETFPVSPCLREDTQKERTPVHECR